VIVATFRYIDTKDDDVVLQRQLGGYGQNASPLRFDINLTSQHHHHVDVRVRTRIAARLRTEEHESNQALAVQLPQPHMEFGKHLSDFGRHRVVTVACRQRKSMTCGSVDSDT